MRSASSLPAHRMMCAYGGLTPDLADMFGYRKWSYGRSSYKFRLVLSWGLSCRDMFQTSLSQWPIVFTCENANNVNPYYFCWTRRIPPWLPCPRLQWWCAPLQIFGCCRISGGRPPKDLTLQPAHVANVVAAVCLLSASVLASLAIRPSVPVS